MKKQISSLAFLTLFGIGVAMGAAQDQDATQPPPPAGGQAAPHRQMDPNRQAKMLTKRLKLTQDQQNQILPILTDRQQQFENIRNDSSLSAKGRHEKMRTVREDSESKIKAVLTDDQKKAYADMQQQMRERRQQRQNSGQGSVQ